MHLEIIEVKNTFGSHVVLDIVVALLLFASGPSVMAHHSSAMFDAQNELILTGIVTKFDYLNPHAWLYISVTENDGSTTDWGFEMSAPPLLRRSGVSPNNWKPGDLVQVRTAPLKDGRSAGSLRGIIKSNGNSYRNAEGLVAP
tara:strand:- start:162 stop:590 length:429 start_codon:yes stop_codon:yes gene_type:complete